MVIHTALNNSNYFGTANPGGAEKDIRMVMWRSGRRGKHRVGKEILRQLDCRVAWLEVSDARFWERELG